MGDQTNPKGFNWVAWISTVAVIILTLVVCLLVDTRVDGASGLLTGLPRLAHFRKRYPIKPLRPSAKCRVSFMR